MFPIKMRISKDQKRIQWDYEKPLEKKREHKTDCIVFVSVVV